MLHRDIAFTSENRSPFEHIAEFAYIAWPVMLLEDLHHRRLDTSDSGFVTGVDTADQCIAKRRQIVWTIAQRRKTDLQNAEPEKQILAEHCLPREFSQRFVRGC